MLVLSRKEGERLVIGDNVVITVNRISGNRITLGIEAPRDVRIVRGELEPKNVDNESAQPSRTPLAFDVDLSTMGSRVAG